MSPFCLSLLSPQAPCQGGSPLSVAAAMQGQTDASPSPTLLALPRLCPWHAVWYNPIVPAQNDHRNKESLRLEKASKITESNHCHGHH